MINHSAFENSMGKANKNSENNIFKWSIQRNGDNGARTTKHKNTHESLKNCFHNYSSYSIIPTSEVTQGAVEVWATLPDEIRQDPSLASFREEHERIHGESFRWNRTKSKFDEHNPRDASGFLSFVFCFIVGFCVFIIFHYLLLMRRTNQLNNEHVMALFVHVKQPESQVCLS